MVHRDITGQRLAALALLGWLLFNQPLLGLFSRPHTLLGVPVLYLYLFGVWALLILLMARLAERRRGPAASEPER